MALEISPLLLSEMDLFLVPGQEESHYPTQIQHLAVIHSGFSRVLIWQSHM